VGQNIPYPLGRSHIFDKRGNQGLAPVSSLALGKPNQLLANAIHAKGIDQAPNVLSPDPKIPQVLPYLGFWRIQGFFGC